MYRALLMGLLVSCTAEPGVGKGAVGGDSKPIRAHEIQSTTEATAIVDVLLALTREASIGAVPHGVGGTATLGDHVISFDDFAFRSGGATMTLAGDLSYRRELDGRLALDGVVDVVWSDIADTLTLADHQLTTAGGLTITF